MAVKTPIRGVFDSGTATGLAEFQSGDFIALTHGGLGAALSIGSAGQVLKVNSGGSAVEFGSVETVLNIDGATDGAGITLVPTDKLLVSDNGKGIPEEVKDLIFEPKFTTKTSGMGLGLPMIKNIIEAYDGSISFSSCTGESLPSSYILSSSRVSFFLSLAGIAMLASFRCATFTVLT